jgi:hypothetical protein
MLGGNKRKMKNNGGNMMRNNMNRKNFPQQNFNQTQQFSDQNPGFMDFSNNFNDQQQQPRQQNNNMNMNMNMNKRKMNGQQNRTPNKKNFQNGGNSNWNNNGQQQNQQQRRGNMNMNQQNQFQQFNNNPPQMQNQRMQQNNFRNNNANNNSNNNNNMRNNGPSNQQNTNNNFQMQSRRRPQMNNMNGPPMNVPQGMGPGPMVPPQNMRGGGNGGGNGGPPVPRRQFPKFNNTKNNRKNPNLTKVDKPKNRKQLNMNRKNGGSRGKKRQRDPYSLEAPFVTDEIKEEHKKKEDILESLKGKGKNDDLFAKFKEQRDVFVKKYDEAKAAYQAEKKVSAQ